jgi:hypothetical protein
VVDRKMQDEIAKEGAQARPKREDDIVYWVVFVPRSDVPVPPKGGENLWTDPWRVRLPGNPHGNPGLVEYAIAVFESKHNLKSWKEIAVSHHVEGLENP